MEITQSMVTGAKRQQAKQLKAQSAYNVGRADAIQRELNKFSKEDFNNTHAYQNMLDTPKAAAALSRQEIQRVRKIKALWEGGGLSAETEAQLLVGKHNYQ